MTVTGPDFIALQVRDLDRAAAFYETHLGLRRAPVSRGATRRRGARRAFRVEAHAAHAMLPTGLAVRGQP